MKAFFIGIACLVGVLGLSWLIMGNEFFLYKFFAPKQAQVQREVFENTRSFNQGMVQELENMQFDYVKEKDLNAKSALRSVILHRASGYNLEDSAVPYSLKVFINELKNE